MRAPAETASDGLLEAHDAADTLASERFRSYLPGRLLSVLVARFRDDTAEALGMELPPLPQRPPVRPAKLSELTSSELGTFWGAVDALVERFTALMDDPELPRQLTALREELVTEEADRARIADEFRDKARAS